MKKAYLLLGTLAVNLLPAKAQPTQTTYQKKKLTKTDIELLYNHYTQDGEHSAVTGGQGTEKLTVYAPSLALKHTFKNQDALGLKMGTDVITSASTDNIDFVVSSASAKDIRTYSNINYYKSLKDNQIEISIGTGFSIESDYLSIPLNLALDYISKNKMRTYGMALQVFLDDLRWGRLDRTHLLVPKTLIYPQELRHTEWHDTHKRQSYNLKTSLTQVINKRNRLGIFPVFTYQQGLLATPFHRIYFADSSQAVENLPDQRFKGSVGVQLNSFIGSRTIVKNGIDFYADSFGVLAIGLENETTIKLNSEVMLTPFVRVYWQEGSTYFAPFGQHEVGSEFFTSDYDLSTFQTYKVGLGFRYAPNQTLRKNLTFKEIRLRYAYYHRSDDLRSHVLSLAFQLANRKGKGKTK